MSNEKTKWQATIENDQHDIRHPEVVLWRRVVLQAFIDATKDLSGVTSPVVLKRMEKEKREAIAFFTTKFGVTATSFHEVCQAASLNPHIVRARVKEALDKGEVFKYLSLDNPGELKYLVEELEEGEE